MTVSFKPGVKGPPSAGIQQAINIAAGIYAQHGQPDLVVTSLRDGIHLPTSLHYSGNAVDLRIWGLNSQTLNSIVSQLRSALGHPGAYEVYLESDHIHIEFNGPGTAIAPKPPQPGAGSGSSGPGTPQLSTIQGMPTWAFIAIGVAIFLLIK